MDVMTPDLIDFARDHQGASYVIFVPIGAGEHVFDWNDTDDRWSEILEEIEELDLKARYCAVITTGLVVNNATYEVDEHTDVVVVHPAGHQCYRLPYKSEVIQDLGERSPYDLDFDVEALREALGL